LKLEVPEELGVGCKVSGNKVIVQHSAVKNAVAYETYNSKGELLRITMYGLGSDDNHSYTQVLYPTHSNEDLKSAYILAVGYDGTRIKIYEEGGIKEEFTTLYEQAKKYATRVDDTGKNIGFLGSDLASEYTSFIAKLDSLIANTDVRERPYGVWTIELKEYIAKILKECTPMVPDKFYLLSPSNNSEEHIGNSSNGLKTYKFQEESKPKSLKWKFVQSSTEGHYYIQHLTTELYITSAQNGQRVKAESRNITDAIAFTVNIVAPGELHIQCADNEMIRLYDKSGTIYAGMQTIASARWFMRMDETEDNLSELPQTSTEDKFNMYYMIRTDNGEYAYSSKAGRTQGRITSAIYTSSENHAFWFYFKQGEQEDRYTIYNYETGKPITQINNALYTNKDAEAQAFTISPTEENIGYVISTEGGSWFMTTTSPIVANISPEQHTTWKFQHISTIDPNEDPSANITGDKIKMTPLIAHCSNGVITISGLTKGSIVNIYNAIGRLIASETSTGNAMTIGTGIATNNIIIITAGERSIKLQVK
jgi:hypothetical protein